MIVQFVEAKSFGVHISKPKQVPGNTIFDASKMIVWCLCFMAMYHGHVSWLCIMAISWLCILRMFLGYIYWLCIMAMYHVSWLCIMVV